MDEEWKKFPFVWKTFFFFFCTCKTLLLDLETLFQHLVPIFLQLLQETLVELLLPPFGLVFDVGQSDVAQEPA